MRSELRTRPDLRPDSKLPAGFLEIGYDGMGGRIIMPLVGPHRGEVWYLDTEDWPSARVEWFDRRDVWKLAVSFAEFMAGLRPLDNNVGDNASPA